MNFNPVAGLIDPLIHLEDVRYTNVEDVLQRAQVSGVKHLIWGGTVPEKDLQNPSPNFSESPHIWRAYGLHPAKIKASEIQNHLQALQQIVAQDDTVAIGEIGLDARKMMPDMILQEEVFLNQLEIARDANLPVIIHAAKAWGRVLLRLKQFGKLPAGGLLHCFSASPQLVTEFAKMDLLMSFGGLATHEKAKKVRLALKAVPISLLAVESDGPDHPWSQASRPYSEPSDLPFIYNRLSKVREESPGLLVISVTRNLYQTFEKLRSEV